MPQPKEKWELPKLVRGAYHRDDMADEQKEKGTETSYLHKDNRARKGQRVILHVLLDREPGFVHMYGDILAINEEGDVLAGVSMRGENPEELVGKWLAKLSFHREFYDAGPWIVEMLQPAGK